MPPGFWSASSSAPAPLSLRSRPAAARSEPRAVAQRHSLLAVSTAALSPSPAAAAGHSTRRQRAPPARRAVAALTVAITPPSTWAARAGARPLAASPARPPRRLARIMSMRRRGPSAMVATVAQRQCCPMFPVVVAGAWAVRHRTAQHTTAAPAAAAGTAAAAARTDRRPTRRGAAAAPPSSTYRWLHWPAQLLTSAARPLSAEPAPTALLSSSPAWHSRPRRQSPHRFRPRGRLRPRPP